MSGLVAIPLSSLCLPAALFRPPPFCVDTCVFSQPETELLPSLFLTSIYLWLHYCRLSNIAGIIIFDPRALPGRAEKPSHSP